MFSNTVDGTVKSTTTSGLDSLSACSNEVPSAGSARADQLHVVRALDGGADRLAHPARGARDRDADHVLGGVAELGPDGA